MHIEASFSDGVCERDLVLFIWKKVSCPRTELPYTLVLSFLETGTTEVFRNVCGMNRCVSIAESSLNHLYTKLRRSHDCLFHLSFALLLFVNFVSVTQLRYYAKRIVNIMKVYIERNKVLATKINTILGRN